MTGWKMYGEIHQLKSMGFKKSQVARQISINVKTVKKYWDLDPGEFAGMIKKSGSREKRLTPYHDVILCWLQQHPDMSASQLLDWLKEHYPDAQFRERTVRRFATWLREKHGILKKVSKRQYQAVPDPPMGKQMQVDFGETTVRVSNGGFTKIYGMGAVLSHSRYKYAQWSDKPLTTATFVQMLGHCFDYLDGVPEELVFDQDKLVAVSENYGDIIYTYEFERFKQSYGFKVRLCKANDPESKGRVEAVIKYMKRNFAANRLFIDLRIWNQCCEDWLDRTANSSRHGTTKKVPAEVFLVEQQYLRPVPIVKTIPGDIVTRSVRKDNTILYKSNRYSVPVGTYKPGLELLIKEEADILKLFDLKSDGLVAQHRVSRDKGLLVQNTHHLRDNTKKIEELYEKVFTLLGGTAQAASFLTGIRREKRRYVREQFGLMERLALKYPMAVIQRAVTYCLDQKFYSAVDCRDAAAYFLSREEAPAKTSCLNGTGSSLGVLRVKAEQRSITAYTRLLGGEEI